MQKDCREMKAGVCKGRPREFNIDEALDRALQVFWRKGYGGTSLADLTAALGISRPSLYAAFGDKETLFRKVLDRYQEGPAAYVRKALNEPTARTVVQQLLHGAADRSTDPANPPGCLFVQGALACAEESIRQELQSRRMAGERALALRLKRAQAEGDLPPDANSTELARYIVTVAQGIAVQAASGARREALRRVIQTAMRAWPSS